MRLAPLLLVLLAACSSSPRRQVDAEKARQIREDADAAYKDNQFRRAIELYTRAIEANPDFADAYHWRGNAWVQLARGDASLNSTLAYQNAEADYTAAINRNPLHYEAFFNRGCLRMGTARTKDAASDFIECTRLRSRDPEPHLHLGEIYETRFEDRAATALDHYDLYIQYGGRNEEILEKVKQYRELKKQLQPAPIGKPPTADDEKKASELHDAMMALAGQNKKAEASLKLDELLNTYGHTQFVKKNMDIYQSMKKAFAPPK